MGKLFGIFIELLAFALSLLTGTNIPLKKKKLVKPLPVPGKEPMRPLPSLLIREDPPWKLGMRSKRELIGVHPMLVKVVKRAIQITDMDFTVFDGKRTAKEQNRHFKNGASQLDGYRRKSYHQTGNAVDLVPVVNGRENHADWDNYYHVAAAMVKASNEFGYGNHIRWGAVWDRRADKLPVTAQELKRESRAYVARRKKAGHKTSLIDGPHYEWRV